MNERIDASYVSGLRNQFGRFKWNKTADAELRRLWADGLSTAKIGAQMGISKNAVIGRSHRLSLPPRQSPIKARSGEPGVVRVQVVDGRLTRVMAPQSGGPGVPLMRHDTRAQERAAAPVRSALPAPLPRVVLPVLAGGLPKGCRYPLWGAKERPTHVYCDAPRTTASAYCDKCHAICFTPSQRQAARRA